MKPGETVYICYGKDSLKGYLTAKNINQLRTLIGLYNAEHKDKIVRFVDPIKKRNYEVKR